MTIAVSAMKRLVMFPFAVQLLDTTRVNLVEVDGKQVNTWEEAVSAIRQKNAGDDVQFTFARTRDSNTIIEGSAITTAPATELKHDARGYIATYKVTPELLD